MGEVKNLKISNKMQEVAVDILSELEMVLMRDTKDLISLGNAMNHLAIIVNSMAEKYNLSEDPFTHMLCTGKEYSENQLEYDRQLMEERYGHHDGI